MIVFFDCETNGLPDWRAPSDAPHQPHLVQLAWWLCDPEGLTIEEGCHIIRPDGWTIPPDNAAIHGITQEIALEKGIGENEAVARFLAARDKATLRVAHNISFDDRIMRIAMLRYGLAREEIERLERQPLFCTMRAADRVMKMAPTEKQIAAGFGNKSKPPKLSECVEFFFGETLEKAHSADADMRACARVYFYLQNRRAA